MIRRIRPLYLGLRVAYAWWTSLRYRCGWISSSSGTLHASLDPQASVDYIQEVVADYLTYGGLTALTGKVAEVGPGDNAGVALRLRALGAEAVDLVDRFYARRDESHQAAIYARLAAMDARVDRLLEGADLRDERTFPGIRRWYGPEAAAEVFFQDHRGYSLIVSRAVLEHCQDPIGALQDMVEALEPGGMLLHKVDLRDHGILSPPHGELEWLTISPRIHRWMTESGGLPNRVLLHRYQALLETLGLPYEIYVTCLVGSGEIRPHPRWTSLDPMTLKPGLREVTRVRPRLATEFRDLPSESLAVSGIFIRVDKSPASGA